MRSLSLLFMLVSAHLTLAQTNGELIDKVLIKDFESLEGYIFQTEDRKESNLDPYRFEYLSEVSLFGITYWSDSLKVKGFLVTPKKKGIYPAIIYNRGGSLDFGSLTDSHASIGLGELARLAHSGYVIAASQYRGNGGGEGKEQYGGKDINDVLNLIPILEEESMADTSRLGLWGWSRGGMQSFLTLRTLDRFKALAVGGPSTNLVRSAFDRPILLKNWNEIIPGINIHRDAVLAYRSAINWVNELPRDLPILILQGGADVGLKPEFTLDFAKELSRFKIPYRLIIYENGTHSLRAYRDEFFIQLVNWFDKYL